MSIASVETQYLIEMCIKNDRKAQGLLYRKFASRLYGTSLRYAGGKDDAQEILQDAFIKIFKNLKNYLGTGSLEGWMKRIVIRTAIEHLRKKHRNIQFEAMQEPELSDWTYSYAFEQMNADEIMKAMEQMPTGYRMVLNMYAIEGYSHKEIAEELKINEGTSKSQLARARKYLYDYLEVKNKIYGKL